MQKARCHPQRGSNRLQATGFRGYFTPLFEVLFTFPSQYWFTIGLQGVFSLTGWSPLIHAKFLVFRATQDTNRRLIPYLYGAITLFRLPFQIVPINIICHSLVLLPRICRNRSGLGSSAFARHYSRNHFYFLLLLVLRCFSSQRSPSLQNDISSICRVAPFGYLRI